MKVRAIITGATGMVGEGVLHECLTHPAVEAVLSISRRTCGIRHEKLKELLHPDFSDFRAIEGELGGYNAAFLCMGVSSIGLAEDAYRHLTYDLTMALARPLSRLNPDMTVCYVSGMGTDSTGEGRVMWARVKGRTENDLMLLPFRSVYLFRPGFIRPTMGLRNTHWFYRAVDPLIPLATIFFPGSLLTLREVGLAMINSVGQAPEKRTLEVRDIAALARRP